ncbi:MAG: hypothetical protein ABUK08_00020 [Candidatus Humimicrobiaceae bacterium]
MAITIDQLRLMTGDTGTPSIMEDAQYTLVLEIESSNIYNAAFLSCNSIAGIFAIKVSLTAGPVKIENQQKYEHYTDLADKYRQMAREGQGGDGNGGGSSLASAPGLAGVSISEMESVDSDPDRVPSKIKMGMDDNEDSTSG